MMPVQIANDDDLRSQYMRHLIADGKYDLPVTLTQAPPRVIVQFWNDRHAVPADVEACLNSWSALEALGFERLLFDDESAEDFINENYDVHHVSAFKRCVHPAMRSDFFRLSFMSTRGGIYVDADDEYQQGDIGVLFRDGRLKLQPLCYDIRTDSMLEPFEAARTSDEERIFYVNNNPLIAPPNNPIVIAALERATVALLTAKATDRDVQALTGPGNLTAALVAHAIERKHTGQPYDFALIPNWNEVAVSKWPLDYRADDRNWRNWVRGDG